MLRGTNLKFNILYRFLKNLFHFISLFAYIFCLKNKKEMRSLKCVKYEQIRKFDKNKKDLIKHEKNQ